MSIGNDVGLMFLIVITIYSKYACSIENSNVSVHKKTIEGDSGSDHYMIKNGDLNSPIDKPPDTEKPESKIDNRITEYSLEGGGVSKQTSKTLVNNLHVESEEEGHPKGSKGRKGVAHQGSSVVPRKGVDNLEAFPADNILPGSISSPESTTTNIGKITSRLNVTEIKQNSTTHQTTLFEEVTQKIQAKKPEAVSDLGDANDFDTYTIIKTSTTGEDYVIIGIVIVIGIWFSVFGALIFYRRAGEYWDRRHYRRMDFLVEGMYND